MKDPPGEPQHPVVVKPSDVANPYLNVKASSYTDATHLEIDNNCPSTDYDTATTETT